MMDQLELLCIHFFMNFLSKSINFTGRYEESNKIVNIGEGEQLI